MIERFRVMNYKALRDVSVELGRVNVLVGPNDSGKTSFLEAIGALGRSTSLYLAEAFVGPWRGRQLVTTGDDSATVTLEAQLPIEGDSASYHLEVSFELGVRVALRAAEWCEWRGTRIEVTQDPALADRHSRRSTFAADNRHRSIGSDAPSFLGQVGRAIGRAESFRFEPSVLALPCAADAARRFRIDASGFGLALCLDDILGHDRARFATIEERMRAVFPSFRMLRLVPEKAFRSPPNPALEVPSLVEADGKALYFVFDGSDAGVPASQVSDGMLLVLAYLTILAVPNPPRLLLIEEPENGIHPRRLGEVIGIVRDIARQQSECQIIMTTHSPYVVDLFEPHEVYACRNTPERGVVIQRLSDSRKVHEQIRHFTLGEIWSSEGEDALADQVADVGPDPE